MNAVLSDGASKDYDFSTKKHWRRWIWNRIKERLTVPVREAKVLLLPGIECFDIPIALDKGFAVKNLIAVERNKAAVLAIRNIGIDCINGDYFEVLRAFTGLTDVKINVVYGDFCGGVSADLVRMIFTCLPNSKLLNSVFAFNLLRGRDPMWNGGREAYAQVMQHAFKELRFSEIQKKLYAKHEKHRGLQFSAFMQCVLFQQYLQAGNITKEECVQLVERAGKNMRLDLSTYSSGPLKMDSLVCRNLLMGIKFTNADGSSGTKDFDSRILVDSISKRTIVAVENFAKKL